MCHSDGIKLVNSFHGQKYIQEIAHAIFHNDSFVPRAHQSTTIDRTERRTNDKQTDR